MAFRFMIMAVPPGKSHAAGRELPQTPRSRRWRGLGSADASDRLARAASAARLRLPGRFGVAQPRYVAIRGSGDHDGLVGSAHGDLDHTVAPAIRHAGTPSNPDPDP